MNDSFIRKVVEFKSDLENYTPCELRTLAKSYKWIDVSIPLCDLIWLIAIKHAQENQHAEMPVKIPDLESSIELGQSCLKGLEIKKILGSGTYGVVSSACIKDDCTYAVKIQYLGTDQPQPIPAEADFIVRRKNADRQQKINDFETENGYSSLFYSHGIGPKYYGGWQCTMEVNGIDQRFGIIVTELWDGSLSNYHIRECDIDPKVLEKLFREIQALHKAGYVHADIVQKNVLVKTDTNNKITDLTLTDFGLSKPLDSFKSEPGWISTLYDYYTDPAFKLGEYFKMIKKTDVQLEPGLADYALIYALQNCNTVGVDPKFKQELMTEIEKLKKSLSEDEIEETLKAMLDEDKTVFLFEGRKFQYSGDEASLRGREHQLYGDIIKGPYDELQVIPKKILANAYGDSLAFRSQVDARHRTLQL